MFKVALISILIPFLSFNQLRQVSPDSENIAFANKQTITGKLQYTSFSQGGAYRSNENIIPFPLSSYTLCVVRIDQTKGNPKFVCEFTTDDNGNFSLKLEPGIYGFVHKEDLKNLTPTQCLPPYEHSGTPMQSSSSTWESNIACPLIVSDQPIKGLVITNHKRSLCGLCP